MPRSVRNFWIDGDVDGGRKSLSGGPRARDGGISLTLYQRNDGDVATALTVHCVAGKDGTLLTEVEPELPFSFIERDGKLRITTQR